MTCTHTDTNSRAGSFYKDEKQGERIVLACTLHVHPRLQACNTILYQVGRIDWKERKRVELQESGRERADFCSIP